MRLQIIFNSLGLTASYWQRTADEGLWGVEGLDAPFTIHGGFVSKGRASGRAAIWRFLFFEVTRVSGRAGVGHARRGGRPPKDTILPIQLQRTGYMGPRMTEKKDHGPRTDHGRDTIGHT